MESKYNPTEETKKKVQGIYEDLKKMRELRDQKWKYFNDRNLKDFINDSQLRLNGYVPDRASQGKETWQSNFFHPVTRNKFKAMMASIALDTPNVRIVAQNEKSDKDRDRAEIMKNLVKYSYDQENKEEQIFFEAWEAAEKGTVVVYDGYLKSKSKKKIIKSFDLTTGEIETEEQEIETDNQCINLIVPLMNFFVSDITIFDVQKQPSVAWVERMDEKRFEKEFSKYKDYKYVPTGNQLTDKNLSDVFFKEYWSTTIDKDKEPIEVVRYFNKGEDQFSIVANGVLLLDSPILLGKKKKWYPFAKTVFEPFASDFFYGNSLPNLLMGEQDVINSLYNMALDKTYKSIAPALLIGNVNKDDFDLEDQNTTIDTKIYVQDISQVREMPIKGLDAGDLKMIELVSRGLDLSSVDSNQQGVAGRGVTAREVVIANENAKKLKGIIYMFLTDLWIQKIKLRIMNILTFYTKPMVAKYTDSEGKEQVESKYPSFNVENTDLSSGDKGTLGIQMVGDKSKLPSKDELDIQEAVFKKKGGVKHELIAITRDYLDDWVYDVKVESESLYQKETGLTQVKVEEKLRVLATYFPQVLMANQEKLAKDSLIAYEDDPDDYDLGAAPPPPMENPSSGGANNAPVAPGEPGKPGMGGEPGQSGMAAPPLATASKKNIPPLRKL